MDGKNPLFDEFTLREDADKCSPSQNTVTQWCNREKFTEDEARKSSNTWLVTLSGMERLLNKNKPSAD